MMISDTTWGEIISGILMEYSLTIILVGKMIYDLTRSNIKSYNKNHDSNKLTENITASVFILLFSAYFLFMIYAGIHAWREISQISHGYIPFLSKYIVIIEAVCMYLGFVLVKIYANRAKNSKNETGKGVSRIMSTSLGNNIFGILAGIIIYILVIIVLGIVKIY